MQHNIYLCLCNRSWHKMHKHPGATNRQMMIGRKVTYYFDFNIYYCFRYLFRTAITNQIIIIKKIKNKNWIQPRESNNYLALSDVE